MSISIVPSEQAAKVVQGLLAIRKVVIVVASRSEGEFILDRFFERSRSRRSDLKLSAGRVEPVDVLDGGYIVHVAGVDISGHGAVTIHAREMTQMHMAEADRLIVHIDADVQVGWTNAVSELEDVVTVVVA
jgi:hypothetical protein